jgi:hypothetical protein
MQQPVTHATNARGRAFQPATRTSRGPCMGEMQRSANLGGGWGSIGPAVRRDDGQGRGAVGDVRDLLHAQRRGRSPRPWCNSTRSAAWRCRWLARTDYGSWSAARPWRVAVSADRKSASASPGRLGLRRRLPPSQVARRRGRSPPAHRWLAVADRLSPDQQVMHAWRHVAISAVDDSFASLTI